MKNLCNGRGFDSHDGPFSCIFYSLTVMTLESSSEKWRNKRTNTIDSRQGIYSRFASGFGQHLAIPIMRRKHRNDMSEAEAREMLEECNSIFVHACWFTTTGLGMNVLYYRDCYCSNKVKFATITAEGYKISNEVASASCFAPPIFVSGCSFWQVGLSEMDYSYYRDRPDFGVQLVESLD